MPEENKTQEEKPTAGNPPQSPQETRSSIRTLRADAAEFIKKNQLSLVDLVAMKNQNDSGNAFYPSKKDGLVKAFFKNKPVLALLFLVLTLLGLGAYFFLTYEKEVPPTVVARPPAPILISQVEKTIDLDSDKNFKTQISTLFSAEYKPGDLVYIPIKKTLITETPPTETTVYLSAKGFLETLKTRAPASLSTFLENNFFLGIINLDKNHPVLIFEAEKNYEETVYSGMLSWEKNMLSDIGFMLIDPPTFLETPVFKDKIFENNHLRIIEVGETPIFMYAFLNKKFIIITDSENALKELIKRFVLFKFS